MLAIASTHLAPRASETEAIVGLLQRILDSKTAMGALLKTNDMLPEYLAKILGKDTEQLDSQEVFNFAKTAFSSAVHRYLRHHRPSVLICSCLGAHTCAHITASTGDRWSRDAGSRS
jgi:hypothetical protein